MSGCRLAVWPPLPPSAHWRHPPGVPFPLDRAECRLFSRARHGLWHGARALGLGAGSELLVPAWHHGSEIEALVRARASLAFYRLTPSLEPDAEHLERLVGPRTRALYLIHYLGFPQDAARWRQWCDERALLLVEDAAQAWLSSRDGVPSGARGNLSLFCLYKTVGLPDGAAVLADALPPTRRRRPRADLRGLTRVHAAWLAQRTALLPNGRPRRYSAARDFELGNPDTPPARVSVRLARRLGAPLVAAQRRANYERLLATLGRHVSVPFAELPPGAVPFAFPLELEHKPVFLERLRARGIVGLNLWSVPHPSLPAEEFPREGALRARVVGLPVHQELRRADIDDIAEAAADCLRSWSDVAG